MATENKEEKPSMSRTSSGPSPWSIWGVIVFAMGSATAAFQMQTLAMDWVWCAANVVALAAVLFFAMTRHLLAVDRTWGKMACWVAACLVLSTLASLVAGQALQLAAAWSKRQFETDRAEFLADPQGFPMIKRMAREQYGVRLSLGGSDSSWARTSLQIPGSSSASMEVRPGFCLLHFHRKAVLSRFPPKRDWDSAAWLQGFMVHELAHCLDAERDAATFGSAAVRSISIAPKHAASVVDEESWLFASAEPKTRLWREALADTMAVGYWKLAAPESASAMSAALRKHRAAGQVDQVHATMCWIDVADRAAPPKSTAELLSWADTLRRSASCD